MSIVKMKRMKVIALARERSELLTRLMRLGCVEISEPEDLLMDPDWTSLLSRDTSELGQVRMRTTELGRALDALKKYAQVKGGGLFVQRSAVTEAELFAPERAEAALKNAEEINAAVDALGKLQTQANRLEAQKASLLPWESLDLPLEIEGTEHVEMVLGTLPGSSALEEVRGALAKAAELSELLPVSADKAQQYVLLLCHKSQWSEALEALKPYTFTATHFKGLTGTARENLAALDEQLSQNAREQEARLEAIRAHADCAKELEVITDRLAQDAAKESARERGMTDGTIVFLEGWVPAAKADKAELVLRDFDAAYSFAEPKRYETPPTLLENPWWIRPINMVTEMYSLPAYDSLDPNPLMFPFFVLFYGIMMADMGYGLLMMITSLVVIKKYKPKGTAANLFGLLGICGIPTFLFGALTGGFFGDFIPQLLKLINPASTFDLPHLFTPLNDTLMILVGSMILGAIQVITGMAINFYKLTKRGQFLDALMDVGSWWLVFAGVGVGVATGMWAVAIAGVAALILTQGRSAPTLIGKIVGGVSSLYDITGYFGDILSYSRLMALMLAGSVIAQVFNTLGAIPGNVIFFIIISMAGNTLNFALNILGCYVHDLRLQCLEYFNKFYEDGGRPFAPLAYDTKYVDVE